jgi:hypothetical protein
MHRRLPSAAAMAAITAVTAALAMSVPAPPAAAAPPAVPPKAGASPLLLITGARMAAVQGSGHLTALLPSPAATQDPLISLTTGGTSYEIPAAAVPYLGHGLNPDLFEPAALLAHERNGRLPVWLTYRHKLPALPGVTITHAAGGRAEGYLTVSSAPRFGAALTRQYQADRASARYGHDGLFASDVSIALAGFATPAPATRPAYPMHTLTVTGTDAAGQPDTGDSVIVVNVENSSIFGSNPSQAVSTFYHGAAKYSVPAGPYWAVGEFGQSGLMGIHRVVVLPQFSVIKDTTVHMAASAATSEVTMVTPRRATAYGTNFWIVRSGHRGFPTLVGWANDATPVHVTRTSQAPTVGGLRSYASQQLASPPGTAAPYRYAVDYEDPPGIIPAQHYLVRPEDLAAVSEEYYQAGRSPGVVAFYGSLPHSFNGYVEPVQFSQTMPAHLTAYLGGNIPGLAWSSYAFVSNGKGIAVSGQSGLFQRYPAGEHVTETWNAYPLHPAINVNPDPRSFLDWLQPSATRAGNTLRLTITPFGDNQPGHLGLGFSPVPGAKLAGRYEIDQNGTKVAGGPVPPPLGGQGWFATKTTLTAKPALIRFELSATRTGSAFPLSTASHTVWTWRSRPESGSTLPNGWYCYVRGSTDVQSCVTEPMMSLLYSVPGMSLSGQVPAGHQAVNLTVGHLPLVKPIPVARAALSVSFDGGKTWQAAHLTGSGGHYRAAFTAQAGTYVTIRTTARDAAGGSVTETIVNAFRVAS